MRVGRFEVTALASAGKHATVLQARDADRSFVAVKLAATAVGEQLVEHEQRLVDGIDPASGLRFVPALVDAGVEREQGFLATRWLRGVEARAAASECAGRREVLALCARIARCYAALHAAGVVHGQVHPRHVLVDVDGAVSLLDFAVAASAEIAPPPARLEARFNTLSAPEHAEALLRGGEVQLTAEAEQFSVAVLVYLLVTGRLYAPLRLARDLLPGDVVATSPRSFAEHGLEPWPELERVLARALRRDPAQRFDSTAAFADAIDGIDPGPGARPPRTRLRRTAALAQVLKTFTSEAASAERVGALPAPTCSINFGAAGVAFALTRLGRTTGDEATLELAGRWLAAAEARSASADAFDDGDQLTTEIIGSVSPFHTASGVAAARAFLSDAVGDRTRQQAALDEFRAATAAPCTNLDLTLGRSSVLLVAALLLERADPAWPASERLASHGDEICAGIWRDAAGTSLDYHGIAHGWAGLAYATMMWARVRGVEPPPDVQPALEMLVAAAEPWERGAHWPVRTAADPADDQFWPGWCHGNAGYVFLWNLAASTYGDGAFADLAERAASLLRGPAGVSSLCCGTAGQAYAALNQYRASGSRRWLSLAARLADRGASEDALAGDATTPLSLYKGQVGLALLAVELECPERASMPLFELEPAPSGREP